MIEQRQRRPADTHDRLGASAADRAPNRVDCERNRGFKSPFLQRLVKDRGQYRSLTYKGQAVDVKQVGRELGVRYVLEGAVRKASGRVRINAQQIDATEGAHLLADRFDGLLEDVSSGFLGRGDDVWIEF